MRIKLSFTALCLLFILQLMSYAQPSPGDGGTGTNDPGVASQPAFGYTNGFWIDITSPTTNPWPVVLHGTVDWQDYQLLSKTNLGDPTWVFETNVVGVWGTNVTPVNVDIGTRSNLFIQAIPSPSSMGLATGSGYFDSQTISVPVNGGPSAGMGFIVNSSDFSSAQWVNWSPSVNLFLGSTNGNYDVWFGFIGAGDTTNWQKYTVTVDTLAPVLTISGPAVGPISKPVIQITGYSDKQLSDVSCTVSNSASVSKYFPTLILNQYYDTNVAKFTTNWFQCFDVGLTNGTNVVRVAVRDLAGNITTSNLTYILDYSTDTTAPQIVLRWPQNGTHISGTNFSLRGALDDETANIAVQIVSSGITNVGLGLIERNGLFWVDDLPLGPGTNYLTVAATDAAGNSSVTNVAVVQSTVSLTIDDVSVWALNQPTTTVTGTISDGSYTVSVNGIQANNNGDGTWTANDVPVGTNGTATFSARASQGGTPSVNDPQVEKNEEKPPVVEVNSYQLHTTLLTTNYPPIGSFAPWVTNYFTSIWDRDIGGTNIVLMWGPTSPYLLQTNTYTTNDGQPGSVIMERCDRPTFYSGSWLYDRKALARVRLKTGGKATSSRINLFEITGSANHNDDPIAPDMDPAPGASVDPTTITILGKQLDSTGTLWKTLPDNQTLDITPKAPPLFYTFSEGAVKHKLEIVRDGVVITDTTNTVIVGQRIGLLAEFQPGVPSVTSYSWSVPGNTVSNYVADDSTGTLYRDFSKTDAEVHYVWVDAANFEVSCTVTAMGQTVTSHTYFNVLRPEGKITDKTGTIAVDSAVGDTELHFGGVPIPGIKWTNTWQNADGAYGGSIEWVQTGTFLRRRQLTNETWESWGGGAYALDSSYPYSTDNPDSDSPGTSLTSSFLKKSVDDHYNLWLMYQPPGDAIFVPLRELNWYWTASATKTTNGWVLDPGSSNSVDPSDYNTTTFPEWTINTHAFIWGPE